jgi:hypothetical protein
MTDYLVFQFRPSGEISLAEDHRHPSDQHAIDAAAAAYPEKHVEIWHGARLVRVLMPSSSANISRPNAA